MRDADQVQPELAAPPPPAPTDALVEQWFVETFHNRGFDVTTFTHFRAAADRLKERLRAAQE